MIKAKYKQKYYCKSLIGLAIISFISVNSYCQLIYNDFKTGFKDTYSQIRKFRINENEISIPLFTSYNDDSINELQYLSLNKSDLSLNSRSTAFYYNQDNVGYYEPYKEITDLHSNEKFILSTSIDNSDGLTYQILDKTDSTIIFSIFTPTDYRTFEPLIINKSILTYSYGANPMEGDPSFLRKYDFNGQLLIEKTFTETNSTEDYLYSYEEFLPPVYSAIKNSISLLPRIGMKSYVIDYNTLELVEILDAGRNEPIFDPLLNDYGYMTNYTYDIFPEEDGISFGGTMSIMITDSVSGFPIDDKFQAFYFKYFWDNSYETKSFGPMDIDNRCYAYDYNENTNKRAVVSSLPFTQAGIRIPVEREIMIHVWDENNRDSITILGWGNHVAFQLKLDDNGDVYFAGSHSDAWTTDSQYYFIAKIPEFAVSVMEKQQVEKRLHLYPNPTTDFLNFSDYEELRNKEYYIYNQTGALVKQGRIDGVQVEVTNLPAGSYIITVKNNESTKRFNSVFIKR